MLVPPPPAASATGRGGRGRSVPAHGFAGAPLGGGGARGREIERERTPCAPLRSREKQPWRGPPPPAPLSSATAARLAPSSEPRLSSACQLVPWRRDGTVVALATRCFRPPSPPPLLPPVRETCAARGDIEWGSLGSDPSQLRPLLRE